ncbi:hypothetical protein GS928_25070 [Rhodococcus hoagii]|nr:hypothetical protein [Prescottella equi]
MTITRARLDRMSRGRVGGKSAETALPVRLDRFDQRPTQRPLDHLTLVVGTWAQAAADHTRQEQAFIEAWGSAGLRQLVHNHRDRKLDRAAISTEPAHAAELAAIWLADYVGDLRAVPDAGAMYDEITDAIAYAPARSTDSPNSPTAASARSRSPTSTASTPRVGPTCSSRRARPG